jgi:hypothetical protein
MPKYLVEVNYALDGIRGVRAQAHPADKLLPNTRPAVTNPRISVPHGPWPGRSVGVRM